MRTASFSRYRTLSIGPGTPGGATDNGENTQAHIYINILLFCFIRFLFYACLPLYSQYYYYYYYYYHYIAETQTTSRRVVRVLCRVRRPDIQAYLDEMR